MITIITMPTMTTMITMITMITMREEGGARRGMDLIEFVKAECQSALSSYQIEPTARDIPQNYIGIEALEPYQSILLFILRDV